MVWPWRGGRLLTAHCRDSGEQLQAGAHARVRELATMTAAEPERRVFFGITPRRWLPSGAFEHPPLSARKVATRKLPHAGALIRRQTKSNLSLFCVASLKMKTC